VSKWWTVKDYFSRFCSECFVSLEKYGVYSLFFIARVLSFGRKYVPTLCYESIAVSHWTYCKKERKRARTKPNRPCFSILHSVPAPTSPYPHRPDFTIPVQTDTAFYSSRVDHLEGRPDDFIGCDIPTLRDPRSFASSLSFGQKRASNGCNIRLYWLLELGRPCVHGVISSSALC